MPETTNKVEPRAQEAVKQAKQNKVDIAKAMTDDKAPAEEKPVESSKPSLAELVRDSQKRTKRLMEQNGKQPEVKRTQHK